MDRGVWWAPVHGVAKSQARLSDFTFAFPFHALDYMLVPLILIAGFGVIFKSWIVKILGVILAVIFSFALAMAICRLAKTEDLLDALNVDQSIADLKAIGVGKVIITMIVATIVGAVIVMALSFILGIVLNVISQDVISIGIAVITPIFDAWLLFYENRVMGLLYSDLA